MMQFTTNNFSTEGLTLHKNAILFYIHSIIQITFIYSSS